MSIQKIAESFRTTDGQIYTDSTEALGHQTLLDAQREYEKAVKHYCRLLAESSITKDGEVFNPNRIGSYYYMIEGAWGRSPHLEELSFYDSEYRISKDNVGLLLLGNKEGNTRWYRIDELYSRSEIANKDLTRAREEWLNLELEAVRKEKERLGMK